MLDENEAPSRFNLSFDFLNCAKSGLVKKFCSSSLIRSFFTALVNYYLESNVDYY